MDGYTKDIVKENIEKLKTIFPQCFVEGKIQGDKLLNILGQYVEKEFEKYEFTWKGKNECYKIARQKTKATLIPCEKESENFNNTQNLYIEGDNLEVLKLLQQSYYNKIKVIYIDPPYNTGKDFIYKDDYKNSLENYKKITNSTTQSNPERNGRFHTDWLNMMFPRLMLAYNLLKDDGVIFISIDDNEVDNLKKICNEIFGEENFLANIVWERAYAPINNSNKPFSKNHDYILAYTKNMSNLNYNGLKRDDKADARYSNPDNDPRGVWQSDNFSVKSSVENNIYKIVTPSGRICYPPNGRSWSVSEEKFKKLVEDNRIWFGEKGSNIPRLKRFLNEVKDSITPKTIWKYKEVGHTQEATQKLKELFNGKDIFDFPKTVDLIKRCLELYTDKDDIILDFFSGSSTTAHAVMELNAEDGGNRKYIMVQLPELCKKPEAYQSGYKNICEIGKARIKKAGEKIKKEMENTENLDTGFRVFKLDSTNFIKWDKFTENENELEFQLQQSLESEEIKDDRRKIDAMFEILIKKGIPLTEKIEILNIDGYEFYFAKEHLILVSFEEKIPIETIKKAINTYLPEKLVLTVFSFENTKAINDINDYVKNKNLPEDILEYLE